jgi:hypothetical protein
MVEVIIPDRKATEAVYRQVESITEVGRDRFALWQDRELIEWEEVKLCWEDLRRQIQVNSPGRSDELEISTHWCDSALL